MKYQSRCCYFCSFIILLFLLNAAIRCHAKKWMLKFRLPSILSSLSISDTLNDEAHSVVRQAGADSMNDLAALHSTNETNSMQHNISSQMPTDLNIADVTDIQQGVKAHVWSDDSNHPTAGESIEGHTEGGIQSKGYENSGKYSLDDGVDSDMISDVIDKQHEQDDKVTNCGTTIDPLLDREETDVRRNEFDLVNNDSVDIKQENEVTNEVHVAPELGSNDIDEQLDKSLLSNEDNVLEVESSPSDSFFVQTSNTEDLIDTTEKVLSDLSEQQPVECEIEADELHEYSDVTSVESTEDKEDVEHFERNVDEWEEEFVEYEIEDDELYAYRDVTSVKSTEDEEVVEDFDRSAEGWEEEITGEVFNDDVGSNADIDPPISNKAAEVSHDSSELCRLDDYYASYDRNVVKLLQKYRGRFICVNSPMFPHCEFYLCGTVHVAKNSSEMVREVIQLACPQYVVLELCEGRVGNLDSHEFNVTEASLSFVGVIKSSIQRKSFKALGMGLLTWMQVKASKVMGSKLGGEQSIAAREAYIKGATVILGDRLYSVTVQRIFDALGWIERIKLLVMLLWETLTMNVVKLKDYIAKSESEDDFIKNEISSFSRHMPAFARVVLTERDEYLAQTLMEIAKVGFGPLPPRGVHYHTKGKILAVVGAGHVEGVCNLLMKGEVSQRRLAEISSSSKHKPTWPGSGILQVVDLSSVYDKKITSTFC